MARFALICLAGGAGSGARYLVSVAMARWLGPALPYGTLAVNLTGSFLLGLLAQLGACHGALSPELRTVLGAGFLGGFTTYSSFNHEVLTYLRRGPRRVALLYCAGTLVACLVSGALGSRAGDRVCGARPRAVRAGSTLDGSVLLGDISPPSAGVRAPEGARARVRGVRARARRPWVPTPRRVKSGVVEGER